MAGVDLSSPRTLLKGRTDLGYRRFQWKTAALASMRGAAAPPTFLIKYPNDLVLLIVRRGIDTS